MTVTAKRPSLPELRQRGTELVQWYHSLEEGKTGTLQELAVVVVDIRSQFWDEELGQPDWRGKSWEYRQFIGEMYEQAGIPPDSVSTIQGSLRYHVGNELRKRVARDELDVAGLKAASPKERLYDARKRAFDLDRAMDQERWKGPAKDRVLRWREMVESTKELSRRLEALDVSAVPKREAKAWLKIIADAQDSLDNARDRLQERLD